MTPRSVNCDSCNSKQNKEKCVCNFCNKTLHMTPECTSFTVKEIEVLIKLNANILHVSNSCTEKKGSGDLNQALSTKMGRNLADLNLKSLNQSRAIRVKNKAAILCRFFEDNCERESVLPKRKLQLNGYPSKRNSRK